MKIQVTFDKDVFRYGIELESDDRSEARRTFRGVAEETIHLAQRNWRVEVPEAFEGLHADLHAAAIWHTLRPFVGRRLVLPFGVSPPFAEWMAREFDVELPAVDPALEPRRPPGRPRPTLLYSGGMDSTATALLMPRGSLVLFLDRIVPEEHRKPVRADSLALLDLVKQRAASRAVQRFGHDVHMLRDDHEALMAPYPTWHTEMSALLPYYLADTFDIREYETGDVLGVHAMQGYRDGDVERWGFRAPRVIRPADAVQGTESAPDEAGNRRPWLPRALAGFAQTVADLGQRVVGRRGPAGGEPAGATEAADGPSPSGGGASGDFGAILGIAKAGFTAGLSEVATAFVVARSPLRGKSWSCYHRAAGSFCMRCDKCFKKVMLLAIADDAEFPAELFDHFLALPSLAAIFEREFFDWHHVWYYVFQRVKCRHPFVEALQRQAQQGPDLRMLEKWYPPLRDGIPAHYRDAVVANIERTIGIMSPDDVRALETLDVPPLHAPRWPPR